MSLLPCKLVNNTISPNMECKAGSHNQLHKWIWRTMLSCHVSHEILQYECVIAICFQNGVQIWKGRDLKTVFCRVRHKKWWAKGKTFFYVKPCKKLFSDWNLFIFEHNFENTWLFMPKPHFFVSKGTGKLPVYCTRPVMFKLSVSCM